VHSKTAATHTDKSLSNREELRSPIPDWLILLGLWLAAVCFDVFWLLNDQSPPAWDQGEHLTRALNYWRVLQNPEWFNADWWITLWRQSPGYRAPLVYLATVPIFNSLGRGFDQAVLVNLVFTGLLMVVLYGLGRHLFNRRTGLWAAGFSLLVPSLYALRLDYLLDLGLVTCVVAAFACLTLWRTASPGPRWFWAMGFGVCVGLTILAKPTGILFLVVPVLWIAVESLLRPPRWQHVLQWTLATIIALLVCGPWIQTNWLTIITNSQSNNASWMPPEVVPGSSWSALSYYARMAPRMVTYVLLFAGLGASLFAVLFHGVKLWRSRLGVPHPTWWWKWAWLLSFLLGSYGVLTLLQNKDPRHMAPAVPILVLVLTRGLTLLAGRWGKGVRWGLAGTMVVLMLGAVLPFGPMPPSRLARPLYPGPAWPQPAVIDSIIEREPYLQATLGVVPNTPQINPMTLDFYGNLQNFQVFGREVGFNAEFVPLDARSLPWAVTKTGDQGPSTDAKAALQAAIEQSPDFEIAQTWPLPDGSTLSLHHRQPPPVVVQPLDQPATTIRLESIVIPEQAAPGQTVPVVYQLSGPWEGLRQGLLLLTWQPENGNPRQEWTHDHGIGFGRLASSPVVPIDQPFQVTERSGMILPENLAPGRYRLEATYVNRQSGLSQPLEIPATTLTIAANAPLQDAPEPDLVSLLHHLSQGLATGELDPIFTTIGRINQYDPTQDYLDQAILAMGHRLEAAPADLRWLYTRVMAQVLQQDAESAIATLNQLTTVAPENIYHWLYLGFVHLYAWQPRQADQALDMAAKIDPTMPELKVLQGVAALQQLRFLRAWQLVQASGLLN
jgi:4-amino-4-deoxy-L-arabinose transferase-like glycosyltransferase